MTDFDVTIEQRDDCAYLILRGELDIATGVRFDEDLGRVEATRPDLIVLDLRGLEFMDSTGLRLLIGADQRAHDEGRRLVLVRGNDVVQRVLRVTRLDERLEIVDDAGALAG